MPFVFVSSNTIKVFNIFINHMLQDNPYGYNPQSGGTTPPSPSPTPGGSYIPSEPSASAPSAADRSTFPSPAVPSIPDASVINPLGGASTVGETFSPGAPVLDQPDVDLGGAKRRPVNKKLAIVLVLILIVVGVVGGGAFALLSGKLGPKTTPPPAVQPTPTPEPTPVPEPTPEPEPVPVQSNDDVRVSNVDVLATGLNSYFSLNGMYPGTNGDLVHVAATASPCVELLSLNLIPACPSDPAGEPSFYGYKSDGVTFELTAKLDDTVCARSGVVAAGAICLYKVVGPLQPVPEPPPAPGPEDQ